MDEREKLDIVEKITEIYWGESTGAARVSQITHYVIMMLVAERARHAAACDDVARGCLCGEEMPE